MHSLIWFEQEFLTTHHRILPLSGKIGSEANGEKLEIQCRSVPKKSKKPVLPKELSPRCKKDVQPSPQHKWYGGWRPQKWKDPGHLPLSTWFSVGSSESTPKAPHQTQNILPVSHEATGNSKSAAEVRTNGWSQSAVQKLSAGERCTSKATALTPTAWKSPLQRVSKSALHADPAQRNASIFISLAPSGKG